MRKTTAWVLGSVALLLLLAGRALAPALLEARLNRVAVRGAAFRPSPRALALHRRLRVADLHADSLAWQRDLLARGSRGQVDVPRLVEGGVALQVFGVFTQTPRHLNVERNDGQSDDVTLLAIAQGWPIATWSSLEQRALYLAARLHETAVRSQGRLVELRTGAELHAYLAGRRVPPDSVAAVLGLEGAHALEGDLGKLDTLAAAGFRVFGLTHFFDNDWCGSAHGIDKGGLTDKGRELVRRLEAGRLLIDLAHASPRAIDDVLAMATRPVLVSHTGVTGTCPGTRNLDDAQLRGVARTGGLIGIGFWPGAVCGDDAPAIARAIRHAVDVVGVEHVGLGSDFDGAVTTPFDAAGLAELTEALLHQGFSDGEVADLMGENTLRLLERTLP